MIIGEEMGQSFEVMPFPYPIMGINGEEIPRIEKAELCCPAVVLKLENNRKFTCRSRRRVEPDETQSLW